MIDRRALSLVLFGAASGLAASGLAACASEDDSPGEGRHGHAHEDEPDMLFISPMGEPFRAKPPAPYPVNLWFNQADTNHDGKLDLDEFQADAERFFRVLDINKDGVIDHREIYYYEHKIAPEMLGLGYEARLNEGRPKLWKAQFGGGGIGSPGGPPVTGGGGAGASLAPQDGGHLGDKDAPLIGAAAYGLLADPEPVQGSDIRIAGTITLNDFKTRAQQRFDLLDFDHKGYLTLAGLPETEAQKNRPRHGGFRRGLRRGPDASS